MISIFFFTLFSIFSGYNCVLELHHGNAYGFMSVAEGFYLTSQPHRYRSTIGIYTGPVLLKEFAGTPNQYFDLIKFSNKNNLTQYWALPQQYTLNDLTVIPNDNTDQPLPMKNLVEFLETSVNSKKFVIKSIELKKCVRSNGKNSRISYQECDMDDESQQFLSVAPFLYRGDSRWHSADINVDQVV